MAFVALNKVFQKIKFSCNNTVAYLNIVVNHLLIQYIVINTLNSDWFVFITDPYYYMFKKSIKLFSWMNKTIAFVYYVDL